MLAASTRFESAVLLQALDLKCVRLIRLVASHARQGGLVNDQHPLRAGAFGRTCWSDNKRVLPIRFRVVVPPYAYDSILLTAKVRNTSRVVQLSIPKCPYVDALALE